MTATETMTDNTTWTDAFEALKARYPKVREPIVAALTTLMQNPGIDVDHAKAVAAANGVRITAASIAGAQRLLARHDGADAPKSASMPNNSAPTATTPLPGHVRRPRATAKDIDAEALIKQVVDKIQDAGNAQTECMRDGIRKAISALQAVVDS